MSEIISIETATNVCSVALHRKGKLLGHQTLMLEKSHSSHLIVMIEQLLNNCQVAMSDLKAVAISKGPGSYTGLRIGTATAKGMCYSLDIPLIGVNTLVAMAYQMKETLHNVDYLCPMIDARRMEVYCTVMNKSFKEEATTEAVVVETGRFDRWLDNGKVLFFGNGSAKCREILKGSNSMFVKDIVPNATTVGYLAVEKLQRGEVEDLAYFEPFYLKEYRTTTPRNKIGLVK